MTTHVIDFDRYRAQARRDKAVQRSRQLTKAFRNRREPPPEPAA